ncbi:sesquipedalian-1-like isoform X3 [Centroberyx gerrardi]
MKFRYGKACDVEMKIHGKILTYFQSCNSPVDKEGYLYKKGERNTSYQKRWFVLKGNLLFYKDRPADRDLIGVIVLEGCTVQLCESEEQFAFSLVWSEPGLRTYKFAAEDQAGQESWIKALLSANHNYLALLVMDMEKQYGEAMKAYSSDPAKSFTMPSFSTAEAASSTAWQSARISTLPQHPAPGVGAGPSFSSNQRLQAPPISSKPASKRSPKLWPKRNANVVPINGPAPPLGEWSAAGTGTKEEFSKLHEEFGKDVKELIADWSKRGRGDEVIQEEDLIDFG